MEPGMHLGGTSCMIESRAFGYDELSNLHSCSGRQPRIAMMQPTDPRHGGHVAVVDRFRRAAFGRVLIER